MNRFRKISNKIRKSFLTLIIILTISISFAFTDNYFNISKNIEIFATLYREVNTYYVDEIDASKFIRVGIDAMLKSLDPYTNFYSESQIEDYRFETTGQYGGIGAITFTKDGKIIIREPQAGFPAEKADIRAGDIIIKIDGNDALERNSTDIDNLLKGQPGTSVDLVIKRPGIEKTIEKKLDRAEIKLKSVPYFAMLDDEIGYVFLDGFKSDAFPEVQKAIKALKEKGMKSLVFDLRNNPGGLLDHAVRISGIFIPKGSLVVETKGKSESWNQKYRSPNIPLDTKMPVVVLVNGNSASASEIVSGVIQDYDRGVVVGEKSFGKGLVQSVRPLTYNTQVKVTTAKYYTPSGRCIQALDYSSKVDGKATKYDNRQAFKTKNGRTVYDGEGVMPDVEIVPEELSLIAITLMRKHLIFDYATQYRLNHDEIPDAKTFKLTDEEYQEFVAFLKDKDYSYETETEKILAEYKTKSEKEGYFEAVETEFKNLSDKLSNDKSKDIMKYKDQIKELLEAEIVSRYYFQDGRTEAKFDDDVQLIEAMKILKDKARYDKILTGN